MIEKRCTANGMFAGFRFTIIRWWVSSNKVSNAYCNRSKDKWVGVNEFVRKKIDLVILLMYLRARDFLLRDSAVRSDYS